MSESSYMFRSHADLNRIFYGKHAPTEYLYYRWSLFAMAAFDPHQLASLSVEYRDGDYRIDIPGTPDPSSEDIASVSAAATVDAVMLMHHASETLLRLFIAHASPSGCPWLQMTGLFEPGAYKSSLEKLLGEEFRGPDGLRSVLYVFFGRDTRPDGAASNQEWAAVLESAANAHALLVELARMSLADAQLYNSAKHGMSIVAGIPLVNMSGQVLSHGPGITYLAPVATPVDEGGQTNWNVATQWIDFRYNLALIHIGLMLIDSLWAVAQHRYTAVTADAAIPRIPDFKQVRSEIAKRYEGRPFGLKMRAPTPFTKPKRQRKSKPRPP